MSGEEDWGSEPDTSTPAPIIREVRPRRAAPENKLPHSDEAERHVIGCALAHDGVAKQCREAGLGPLDFFTPSHRVLFETVARLDAAGQPTTLDVVAQELIDRKLLDGVGGITGLMQMSEGLATTAHLDYFITRVRSDSGKREIIRKANELIEQANNGSELPKLVAETKEWAELMAGTSGTSKKADVLRKLQERRITVVSAPPEPVTRLFLAKKPIATSGNIQTVISKAKTGKTTTLGGVVASIIAAMAERSTMDTLGFTSPYSHGHAVIVIDTEQSPYDAYTCYQRTLTRGGATEDPRWLLHYSLVDYNAAQIRAVMPIILEHAKKEFGGVWILILDGVADIVSSVNEEAEAKECVTYLRSLSIQYDTPVLCVIHSNEAVKAGDDGRGHLGKELTRKAETNLLLKKTGEVTVITSDKQRKAPITEADGVAFQWSDDLGRHVSCKAVPRGESKVGRPTKHNFSEISLIFQKGGLVGIPYSQAERAATSGGVSRSTFRRMVSDAIESGELLKVMDERTGGFVFRIADHG